MSLFPPSPLYLHRRRPVLPPFQLLVVSSLRRRSHRFRPQRLCLLRPIPLRKKHRGAFPALVDRVLDESDVDEVICGDSVSSRRAGEKEGKRGGKCTKENNESFFNERPLRQPRVRHSINASF